MSTPLWTVEAMAQAMGAQPHGAQPADVPGLSIDTRTIAPGEAFFALKDVRDGHDFVEAALKAGGGLAVVAASKRGMFPKDAPLLGGDRRAGGADRVGARRAARSHAKFIGVTGSVGKTGTKEALKLALSSDGETHASAASYNNTGGCRCRWRVAGERALRVLEMGMNHAGEIAPLTKLVRPHVAIITTIEPVHLEFFPSVESHRPMPRREIFEGIEPGRRRGHQSRQPALCRLQKQAKAADVGPHRQFGENARADARLLKFALQADSSTVQARILGADITYKLGAPGRHVVMNSLAVLAAASPRRRRSGARGAGVVEPQAAERRPRRADRARPARRRGAC